MPLDGNIIDYTDTEIFSLAGLTAWLERQNPETEYDFDDICDCVLFRYFKARGVAIVYMGGNTWVEEGGRRPNLPNEIKRILLGCETTYGGALQRCYEAAR